MKVKYLFLSLFAALAMTACSDDKDSPVSEGENAQLEGTNYVAVRIGQPGQQTKAGGSNDYETGTPNEFSIKNAYFLFFDGDGKKAAQPQLTKRFDVNVDSNGKESDKLRSTQAIMLEPIDGKLPKKMEMLVLCNVTSELESKINEFLGSENANKEDIMKLAVDFSNAKRKMNSSGMTDSQVKDETFLMSNATYATGEENTIVNLVKITSDNIMSTEAEAKAKPVDVYVERVVAKVNFTKQGNCNFNAGNDPEKKDSEERSMNSEITVGKNTEQKLTLDVLGFWVDNDADKGRLTKELCNVPKKNLTGFTWNNAEDHRSFWAAEFKDKVNYQHKSFNEKTELNDKGNGFVYALENVLQSKRKQVGKDNTWVSEPGNHARLVVATQLKNNNEAVTLYKYLGEYYLEGDKDNGINAALVASNAFNKFYTKKEESKDSEDGKETKEGKEEGNEYTPVTVDDLVITENVNKANEKPVEYGESKTLNNHEVLFTFAAKEGIKFYNSEGEDITESIKKIELVAWKWNDGKAYYFIDMLHFGEYSDYAGVEDENGDKIDGKNFLNGIVRNHVYKYGVNSFVGLGTPVAVGDDVKITPEDPSQGQSFMSAKINVLSWKCVKHDGMELK